MTEIQRGQRTLTRVFFTWLSTSPPTQDLVDRDDSRLSRTNVTRLCRPHDMSMHILFADCFNREDVPLKVHVSSQGQVRPLCRYDYLDLGELEENIRQAQACTNNRHFIVDPDLAHVVAQCLGSDLQNSKTVIFECNPGMFYLLCSSSFGQANKMCFYSLFTEAAPQIIFLITCLVSLGVKYS